MVWRFSEACPLHPTIMKLIRKLYGSNINPHNSFDGRPAGETPIPGQRPLATGLTRAMPTGLEGMRLGACVAYGAHGFLPLHLVKRLE